MRRTADRPLPSGRLSAFEALWFGLLLTAGAEVYLGGSGQPAEFRIGLNGNCGVPFAYTPLKTRTSLSTALGAFLGLCRP